MACCESRLFCGDVPVQATGTTIAMGVVGDACIAKVSQTFSSPTAVRDASFRFPLNDGATVTDFEVSVNGVVRKGEVKPKQRARDEYNSAVASGKSAQLMAQKAKDLFELSLGNFGANENVIISFTYAAETSYADGILSLYLPLFSKHRYGESMQPNQQDASLSDVATSGGTVSIIIDGSIAGGVASITSVNHDVNLLRQDQSDIPVKSGLAHEVASAAKDIASQSNFRLSLVLGTKDPSKQDFVLKIKPLRPFAARAICETDPATGNQAVMLSLMPELPAAGSDDPLTTEIIFVCDVSGSMSGEPLKQAIEALQIFIDSLPVGTAFNVAWFSDNYKFWSLTNGSRVITIGDEAELRANAKAFVGAFTTKGGTQLLNPVKAIASEKPLAGRRRNVVVLTDGATDDEARVMSAITGSAGNTRWFSIGLGEGASRDLCEGIARNGNGTAGYSANETVLAQVVMDLLAQCMQPSVRFSVDWAAGTTPLTAPMSVDDKPTASSSSSSTLASGLFAAVADAVTTTSSAVTRAIRRDPAPEHVTPVPDGMYASPSKQKILFTKLRQTAFYLLDKSKGLWSGKHVTVHVILPNGQDHTFDVPVETIAGNAINALAAHAVISDLEAHGSLPSVIENIAMSRHIISSQTSMLVVNPIATAPAQAAHIHSWKQRETYVSYGMGRARCAGGNPVGSRGGGGFLQTLSFNSYGGTKGGATLESCGFTAMGGEECSFRNSGNECCPYEDDDAESSKKKKKKSKSSAAAPAAAAAPPKPSVASIISAIRGGLWSFAAVAAYLPAEARVWSPAQKSSDLWVTIAILKLLQSDYADQSTVWRAVAQSARQAICAKFSKDEIAAAMNGLQFSL